MSPQQREQLSRQINAFYDQFEKKPLEKRMRWYWENENKRGFFLGLIQEGREEHLQELQGIFDRGEFEKEQTVAKEFEKTKGTKLCFIDEMFDIYIARFHKGYKMKGTLANPRQTSADYLYEDEEQGSRNSSKSLISSVFRRDGVCLFCWRDTALEGAHIITNKAIAKPYDERQILDEAGLNTINDVQNGLVLSLDCLDAFDTLEVYIDVIQTTKGKKYIIRQTNGNYLRRFGRMRSGEMEDYPDRFQGRVPQESNGDLALNFEEDADPSTYPNEVALKWHRAACILWNMAAGEDPEEDDYFDCDDDIIVPVDPTTKIMNLKNWQESSATLMADEVIPIVDFPLESITEEIFSSMDGPESRPTDTINLQ